MAHFISGPNHGFASRFMDARRRINLTQEQLAEKLGIDKRNISKYENGHQIPRGETLIAIAKVFGVDPEEFSTGQTTQLRKYLAEQRNNQPQLPKQVDLLYIQEWSKLKIGPAHGMPKYNLTPSYGLESSNIAEFVPVTRAASDFHRAVRYPGTYPASSMYPPGCVIVYDSGPLMLEQIPSGSDVIFRVRGEDNEPGLRRVVREPGIPETSLVPIDPNMPFSALPLDVVYVDILGVVVARVIHH